MTHSSGGVVSGIVLVAAQISILALIVFAIGLETRASDNPGQGCLLPLDHGAPVQ